jgi:hypothetical protein
MKNPAQRRFVIRMWVAAGLCVLFALVTASVFISGHLRGIPAYLVAILPALPIVGALAGTGAYLGEEKDEFQRNLFVQSLLGGIGGTLAATTVWGYLEDFAHVPHLRLILVYPLFWLFVCVSYGVVRLRYR